ncbi:hypothetical protein [Streptomyces sp. NPDC046984]|uniref:hypothetical protein n=1 Tax=unclassified Streptomyces TaxID=2593676 RepID=UPI003406F916
MTLPHCKAMVGANPLKVVRPCHPVIGAGDAPTGCTDGPARRQQPLDLEHAGQVA